jgi:uncharacterized protein YuzE
MGARRLRPSSESQAPERVSDDPDARLGSGARSGGLPFLSDYDEEADVLYLWVESPCPAVTYETSHGHLVQLDPETREFVGVAIVDYRARWEGN